MTKDGCRGTWCVRLYVRNIGTVALGCRGGHQAYVRMHVNHKSLWRWEIEIGTWKVDIDYFGYLTISVPTYVPHEYNHVSETI